MKIYYPFLKDYLNTDFSAKNMADIFTNLGLECESSNKTLNFDITPNRGDALSLSGLAREFSASQKNSRFIQKPFNKVSFQNLSLIHISEPTRRTPISYCCDT